MQFIRHVIARLTRFGTWITDRRHRSVITPLSLSFTTPIYRDVTRNGVHIYSLCAVCGARLQASATLCEECAVKQSRSARPH